MLTIFVFRLNHHELFACPSRALKGSKRPSHELHFVFHRRQRGKHFFHSFNFLQRLVSLEGLLHVQFYIVIPRWGCSSCPFRVPSSLPPAFHDRKGLNDCCRQSLREAESKRGQIKRKRIKPELRSQSGLLQVLTGGPGGPAGPGSPLGPMTPWEIEGDKTLCQSRLTCSLSRASRLNSDIIRPDMDAALKDYPAVCISTLWSKPSLSRHTILVFITSHKPEPNPIKMEKWKNQTQGKHGCIAGF